MASFLYPPIVESYLPAFIQGSSIEIPYSKSPFESSNSGIVGIHVTIQEQNTNVSTIDTNMGIIECEIDDAKSGIITLTSDMLDLTKFNINTFYKVQLRFATGFGGENFNSTWLSDNKALFSEWSSVCLIKFISVPKLIIEDEWIPVTSGVNHKQIASNKITGYLTFDDKNDTEYLKSYQMKLYDGNKLLESSGLVSASSFNPNAMVFEYHVNLSIDNNKEYKLVVEYTTINGYNKSSYFYFNVENALSIEPAMHWKVYSLEEEGALQLKFMENANNEDNILGNYIISRSSVEDNYTRWEDVCLFSIGPTEKENAISENIDGEDVHILHIWTDYSVEPAILYQYGLQAVELNSSGAQVRGQRKIIENSVSLINIEDIFLFDGQKNLKIRYNPNISSFKQTLLESKTETLGSRFPFIRRNADVKYRQFQLNGLISYNMDDKNYYKVGDLETNLQGYQSLSINSSFLSDLIASTINELNSKEGFDKEIYLERKFRERVMDFLYADNVKLFKSETEGAALIRLMDISLTPENQLGRKIYSFSATAYEVAELTFENLKKYGILALDNYRDIRDMAFSDIQIGQVIIGGDTTEGVEDASVSSYDVISIIKTTVAALNKDLTYEFQQPYFLRFTFISPARAFSQYYGHSIEINGKTFAVLNGVYQVTDADLDLTKAKFKISKEDEVIVDFIYKRVSRINLSTKKVYDKTESQIGQLWDIYNSSWNPQNEDILRLAKIQYEYEIDNEYSIVTGVKALSIEAPPGAIFAIKDIKDAERATNPNPEIHIMNNTGKMFYYNKGNNIISSLYSQGVRLVPVKDYDDDFDTEYYKSYNDIKAPQEFEYQVSKYYYDSLEQLENIKYPTPNMVYKIGTNEDDWSACYICYHGKWYSVSKTAIQNKEAITLSDAPVEAIIDYYFAVSVGITNINENAASVSEETDNSKGG